MEFVLCNTNKPTKSVSHVMSYNYIDTQKSDIRPPTVYDSVLYIQTLL